MSGDRYVTASLVIPIANLLQTGLEEVKPFIELGVAVQKSLLNLVNGKIYISLKQQFETLALSVFILTRH